jgi:SAM-dependent methyltransferase
MDDKQDDAGEPWLTIPRVANEDDVRQRHAANRLAWNEGAEEYARELEKAIAFIRAGKSNVHPVERANLGDLGAWCDSAIHLQCASGKDTLSLWNEGVKSVVGVDISDVQIANARRLSAAVDAPARWVCCDVLDTPHELDGSADLVYTGRGALCWLHDLDGWAAVVARLLKPGGIFHVYDGHPAAWLFDMEADTLQASGVDYFQHAEWSRGWPDAYLGDLGKPIEEHARKYEQIWPLATIFQALTGVGLVVDLLGEYPVDYWLAFPNLPEAVRSRLPLTFAMKAHKPH